MGERRDLWLDGFESEPARRRLWQRLDGEAARRALGPLPCRFLSDLDPQHAADLAREFSRLGARVRLEAPPADPAALPPPRASHRTSALALAVTGLTAGAFLATLVPPTPSGPTTTGLSTGHRLPVRRPDRASLTFPTETDPDLALAAPDPPAREVPDRIDDPEAWRLNQEGVELARQGRFEEAVARLQAARARAPVPTILRNLQAVLTNWGTKALDAGDVDTARQRLEEATALGEQMETLHALGIACLRQGDLEAARQALEQARRLAPRDHRPPQALAEVYERLDRRADALLMLERARDLGLRGPGLDRHLARLAREIDAEWDYLEHTTPHFRLSFADDEDPGVVALVAESLENAHRAVLGRLAPASIGPVAVVLYAREDFHGITQTPDWAGGAFDGRIKLPVGGLLSRDGQELERVVRHELAHAVVRELCGPQCPAWLNEGTAVWAEESFDGEKVTWAERRMAGRRPFALSELHGAFLRLGRDDADVAYAQSYLAVRELLARHGTSGLLDLMKALRKHSVAEAFPAVLRDDLHLFESRLQARLRR